MKLAGPTRVMRKGRIEATLDRLSLFAAIRQCSATLKDFDGEPDEPLAVFASHDSKENVILYPSMDVAFNPVERREPLSAVKAFEI